MVENKVDSQTQEYLEKQKKINEKEETKSTLPSKEPITYNGLILPFFGIEDSAKRFVNMETRESDVICTSLAKGGTTWVHTILFLMMQGLNNDGTPSENANGLGSKGQLYPDGLPQEEPAQDRPIFGKITQPQLFNQSEPRLISTHLFGEKYLPKSLTTNGGKGKLIVVLRNLKDIITSLHFFRGEAKDGWMGNEHGPGSFNRFLASEEGGECPNAYGSSIEWIKQNDVLVNQLECEKRVLVVYFEELKHNLQGEVERIAEFLNMPMSEAKRDALLEAVSFNSMKNGEGTASVTLRKGDIGDWKNHLTPNDWERVDQAFEKELSDVKLAAPLRPYHEY